MKVAGTAATPATAEASRLVEPRAGRISGSLCVADVNPLQLPLFGKHPSPDSGCHPRRRKDLVVPELLGSLFMNSIPQLARWCHCFTLPAKSCCRCLPIDSIPGGNESQQTSAIHADFAVG